MLTGIAVCRSCGSGLVSYTHGRKRKDGTVWQACRCGAYHRSGGSECQSYFIPGGKIERLVLQGVAERLAQHIAAGDAQAYIGQVARRVLIEAQKRPLTLETEARKREVQIMEVVDVGIGRGLDPAACNLRIQALRTEAAEMRTKAHILVEMIGPLENAVDRTQALLRCADDLLLAWDALRPEERRERLQQLVSLIVVEKAGPGGDSNVAGIHFRAVIGSQEAHRKALKDEMAEDAPGARSKRLQVDSGLEADVSQRCWLPIVYSLRNFLDNEECPMLAMTI